MNEFKGTYKAEVSSEEFTTREFDIEWSFRGISFGGTFLLKVLIHSTILNIKYCFMDICNVLLCSCFFHIQQVKKQLSGIGCDVTVTFVYQWSTNQQSRCFLRCRVFLSSNSLCAVNSCPWDCIVWLYSTSISFITSMLELFGDK